VIRGRAHGSPPVVIAALAIGLATCASLARAEQTGGGGVNVSLKGSISPKRLPRHRPVPISVTLEGAIWTPDGSPAPRLASVEFAVGARGGLDTNGLPVCPRARLRDATARQALARCRGALVGRGSIAAEVPLNPEDPIVARAGALAFNGRAGARPAVWVLAYSAAPPVSFVLPFHIRRARGGAFGTLLRAPVARALGRWPRLRSFSLTFGRRYRVGAAAHSYLSADCPLPPRFHASPFPLARATYRFAPRPTHTTTILRACRVRE
jgi:hypothetical protein